MTRVAIIDNEKCKPNKCAKECIKSCPPNQSDSSVITIIDIEDMGKKTAHTNLTNKKQIAKIIESSCIGCNICVDKCPFGAIKIINIPKEDPKDIIHRYNPNGFRLYRLPIMKVNNIIGIIGENGIGKTTLIEILAGEFKPNFELFNVQISDKDIITKFRGSVLQNYLKDLYGNKLIFSIKKQRIFQTINAFKLLKVSDYIFNCNIFNYTSNEFYLSLQINLLLDNTLGNLSGGQLQKLLCWITGLSNANVMIFDEPSNYLDIKQRLEISKMIRSLNTINRYIIVIEHDLMMADYICDEIYIIYGKAGAYGIVSKPLTPSEGINMYLNGYIQSENVRFREEEFNFKLFDSNIVQTNINKSNNEFKNTLLPIEYSTYNSTIICYTNPKYELNIEEGQILIPGINCEEGQLYLILGENATGKTTFVNYLASSLKLTTSIKKQNLEITDYQNSDLSYPTVKNFLLESIKNSWFDTQFQTSVIKPFEIDEILGKRINELSGGEFQKISIINCLGTKANIYMLDEPSANLDIDKRLKFTKIIRKFVAQSKCVFIIEHDIMVCVSLIQEPNIKIFLTEQNPISEFKSCSISKTQLGDYGINNFLKQLNITVRFDNKLRPRINKLNSQLDTEQKKLNKYYGI